MTQLFKFNGNEVRTVIKNGEPWFVLKDVCGVLEIGNPSDVKARLDDGVVSIEGIQDSLGRTQNVVVVNEDGLYDVILESRKPEAKAFRKWITSQVIPSIRKHGAYMTPDTIEKTLTNPDFIIQLATKLKTEQAARIEAEYKLDEQRPMVAFAETCMDSERNLLVREVAKLASKNGIMIGEKRLYQKLREWGMIFQQRTEPTQRAMEMGLFHIKKGVTQTPKGARDFETAKVTPKGQMYIINRLRKEAA